MTEKSEAAHQTTALAAGCLLTGLLLIAGCDSGTTAERQPAPAVVQSSGPQRGAVDDARIIAAAEAEPGSWLTYGQTYKEQRFSKLTGIEPANVSELGLAWFKPIGGLERMQATPLVVDGVMYVNNGRSIVYALDAATGAELWSYDPEIDMGFMRYAWDRPTNRGLAVYKGRVYIATFDGRLVAIDANTGEEVWDVDTWHPTAMNRFNITGAPRAAAGRVFIGQGSGEVIRRRGYVTAYDAETGEVDWRFYLVPGNPNEPFEHPAMEMAAKTWGGEWWKFGGGGTAWNALVYDEELNSLYIGVGNGAPWPRAIRSPGGGDDLFLASIVSVDVESGRMNWYYQTAPGDNWDYTATQDMTLTDMVVDGVKRKVLLQAPKNGFFYVIDRTNGELLRAHPYTDAITWASHVDMETGRPVETPESNYDETPRWILPANAGAHNWEPQSWDDERGIMYFYYHDYPNFYSLDESFVKTGIYKQRERGLSLGIGEGEYRRALEAQAGPRPETRGFITAFNPLTGEHVWRHELDNAFNGGVLATASGILFHPEGAGRFTVRRTDTGESIWSYETRGRFASSIMSYTVDGEQYVATLLTGNPDFDLSGTVLAFKLGGSQVLPVNDRRAMVVPPQPEIAATDAAVQEGNSLYHTHCATCHRGIGVTSVVQATAPDLRLMTLDTHGDFAEIVLRGTRADRGMASFASVLTEDDIEAIRAFLVTEANAIRALDDEVANDL